MKATGTTRGVLRSIRLEPRNQTGFTLVELLVTVSILSVVMGALASGIIVGLRTTDETTQRLSESHDAQIVSAYLANDVQSADRIADAGQICGSGTPMITFQYGDPATRASWYREVVAGETRIVRRFCVSPGVVRDALTLAHFVSGMPTVSCDGGSCAAGARPDIVRLAVEASSGRYAFAVSGSRRPYAPTAGPPARSPFVFGGLGTGSDKQLTISGGGTLRVKGNMYLDCCPGASPSPAPNLITIEGGNSKLIVEGTFSLYRYPSLGGCNGCSNKSVESTNPTAWVPRSFNNHLSDPLAHLPYPDTNEVIAQHGGPYTSNAYQGPGVYRVELRITQDTVMAPGVYLLEKGMSISGQTIVTGSGVMLFNGCGRNAPSGCSNSSSLAFSGGGGNKDARITLEPPTSGTYKDIVIFQHRGNISDLTLSGGAWFTSTTGTMYAPGATKGVVLGSGGSTLTIKGVLATAMSIVGNGVAVVG